MPSDTSSDGLPAEYQGCASALAELGHPIAAQQLLQAAAAAWAEPDHGDMPAWTAALGSLPRAAAACVDTAERLVFGRGDTDTAARARPGLQRLRPWRKGPVRIAGVDIDTEWRSDWKWRRIASQIPSLGGLRILDVGSGNGYYGYRMLGAGARWVLGLDPGWLYVVQWRVMQRYAGGRPNWVLPLRLERLPPALTGFDAAFSLGVLYHRRAPDAHLLQLRNALAPGGRLILETLLVPGAGRVLDPQGRYAGMPNVHFLPAADVLLEHLRDAGYRRPRVVDIARTITSEQRSTEWMPFHSLDRALDPQRAGYTIEGHPAPLRALVLAERSD